MRNIKILLSICLFISLGNVIAQRKEIEQKKLGENPQVVACGKDGLIIFYETTERVEGGRRNWVFTKYDTTFHEIWNKEVAVDRNRDFSKYDLEKDYLYLFLTSSSREFTVLSVHLADGAVHATDSKLKQPASFSDFNVINNKAFLTGRTVTTSGQNCLQGIFNCTLIPLFTGATVYKIKPVIYSVDLKSTVSNIKQVDFKEMKGHGAVLVSEPSSDNTMLDCMVKNYIKPKEPPTVILERYNSDEKKIAKTTLRSNEKFELTTGRLNNLNEKEQLIIGTYSNKPKGKRFVFSDMRTAESEGMYISKVEEGKEKFLKFYEFKQFQFYQKMLNDMNLYNNNSANERRKKRMEKRPLSYLLLVHDIVEKNNQYIMVAETYILVYHTQCYTSYSNGQPYQRCYQVFDGYLVTGAIVAGFSKDGEKLWDNSVSISSSLTYNLRTRAEVVPKENEVLLTYAYNGNLDTKTIKGNSLLDVSSTNLDLGHSAYDQVKSTWSSDVDYWYDNYFIAYGYERIKNTGDNGPAKRNVFFFNKIEVKRN